MALAFPSKAVSHRSVDQAGCGPNMVSRSMDGYQRFLQDPKKAWEERLAPTGASQEMRETIARAAPNPGHFAFVKLEEMGYCAGSSPRMSITCTAVLGVAMSWKFTEIRPWCVA